jgi:hypothetical protein
MFAFASSAGVGHSTPRADEDVKIDISYHVEGGAKFGSCRTHGERKGDEPTMFEELDSNRAGKTYLVPATKAFLGQLEDSSNRPEPGRGEPPMPFVGAPGQGMVAVVAFPDFETDTCLKVPFQVGRETSLGVGAATGARGTFFVSGHSVSPFHLDSGSKGNWRNQIRHISMTLKMVGGRVRLANSSSEQGKVRRS